MIKPTDTSERGFQKLIVNDLIENQGYIGSKSHAFDKEFCVNKDQLFQFIKATQENAYQLFQKKGERSFLLRLDKKIKEKGIVETLRRGVKFFDRTIELFYPQPVSAFNQKDVFRYHANIFSVTEELKYSPNNENRIDLVIFLNGLPIITMELKNAFTKQAVQNAMRQYQYTRSPNDKIFNFGRCMVHFAVDTDWVFMTTHLQRGNTKFFPFNKGLNDGKPYAPYGKENPINPNGLKTSYLWKEILTKPSLCNIIEKFVQLVDDKDENTGKITKKLIFPRYHQLTSVRQLLYHAKEDGVGHRYLIEHSAGSGKSNSITWLAYQLVGLHDKLNKNLIFDTVIVVTDRTVLDEQIKENIKKFDHVTRVVEAISRTSADSKTSQLKAALANKKKIIIVTVQTFPYVFKEMGEMENMKFAIIIDEAHSSQSGEETAKMNAVLGIKSIDELPRDEDGNVDTEDLLNFLIESRRMLTNASYFAFTATPKNKTLETFGRKGDDDKYYPFHLYSMKQAIEEEFIIDVLQNYTTYNSFYKIRKAVEDNPNYETKQANKKLRAYVELNEEAIKEKAKVMIDHFHRDVQRLINGKAKAMVITKSIEAAMKYKDAFDAYLKEIKSPYRAIVAYSGSKAHYKTGEKMRESDMNRFPDGNNDIRKQFKKDIYRFLIVANKFQAGFDEPLLHTMYVDKQLRGVQAVQALTRLNRAFKPYKKDTFILDFYNKADDIKEAFEPYFTTTILSEETDPNKLNDLQDALDEFQVYAEEDVKKFFKLYYEGASRNETDKIIDKSKEIFNRELNQDQQIFFKSSAKSFLRTYSYLSRLLDFNNHYWEMLWLYLKHLTPTLKIEDDPDENIIEAIEMESYRISKGEKKKISLMEDKGEIPGIPVQIGGGKAEAIYDTLENIIKEFNRRMGDISWGEGVDKKEAETILAAALPEKLKQDMEMMASIKNTDRQNAKITSDKKIKDLMHSIMFTHTEIYKKFMNDTDFKNRYEEFIFELLWQFAKV